MHTIIYPLMSHKYLCTLTHKDNVIALDLRNLQFCSFITLVDSLLLCGCLCRALGLKLMIDYPMLGGHC